MKKYLNTLYIATQGAYLSKEGNTIVVSIEREKKLQLPIHSIGAVVCFGNVSVSPFLMELCVENGVAISFHTEYGKYLASVNGRTKGNVLLRREQYRYADRQDESAKIAKNILLGKVYNCRVVLQRVLRDHGEKIDKEKIENVSNSLNWSLRQIESCNELDDLRGLEGDAAHQYFNVFDEMIISQKLNFRFISRNRRPPMDKVNCLLSFIYTLLMQDVKSALESVGLDSYVGFLHRDRPGRPSLALDLMEEFRPVIADRLVLSLINMEQVNKKGFKKLSSGGILMKEETKKKLLIAYQKRKQSEIIHPFLNEKIKIGLIFHIQALLLARYIRKDIDGYPVFFWR